nr:putative reverse transcriptase domain-containing protein [Tanacetum cinerariifolium]
MTPTEVRQFLGLAGYYRRLIEGFSLISKPLTKLTQKDKNYKSGKKEVFQTLKQKLCSAPTLELPEGMKDLVVYCNTSLKGYGAILMQREKKELNLRQQRWIELLSDYDYENRYHPRKSNVVADALSRKERDKPLRSDKMYQDLKLLYWWPNMKANIAMYVNKRAKPLEFKVGDMVLLKVSPWKGAMRFGKHGKISSRYIGPFKILARVSHVAYTLEFPEELKRIHSTFHVLNLKRCLAKGVVVVPVDEIQFDDKLLMIEELVEVVDREVKRLKQSWIPIVKVHWNSHKGPKFTWEHENQIRKNYSHLFTSKDEASKTDKRS